MKYTLPAVKKNEKIGDEVEMSHDYNEYERRVRIPVNAALLKELPVGASATITLVGKVQEAGAEGNYDGASISLIVTSVETDSKNEFEELAEED